MFEKNKKRLLFSLMLCMFIMAPGGAWAVDGQCSNCHTMHNYQDGAVLSADGPTGQLLVGDGCIGCHTGDNNGSNTTPFVNSTSAPTTSMLAGGSFYWVDDDGGNDDTKGHNVYGISTQDGNISSTEGAPGNANSCGDADNCHSTLAESTGGCTGCHLAPNHHGDSKGNITTEPWFRWLAKCDGTGTADSTRGVKGYEDADWSYQNSTHSEYLGVAGGHTSTQSLDNYNMSAFCCGCHGNFHNQNTEAAAGGDWIRHPSDHVIPNSGEYASIGTDWIDDVPLARPASFDFASGSSDTIAAGTDMVMCLSCHRAHGSQYSDMLRWDYTAMVAGGGSSTEGCFACHTEKDE